MHPPSISRFLGEKFTRGVLRAGEVPGVPEVVPGFRVTDDRDWRERRDRAPMRVRVEYWPLPPKDAETTQNAEYLKALFAYREWLATRYVVSVGKAGYLVVTGLRG